MINETNGAGSVLNKHLNIGSPQLISFDSLDGSNIHNLQGDDLGDIKNIMLDISTGHVAYVVLSFGGFFGLGEKLFAVPWNALTLDADQHRFTLNADKEKLKNAPGFDKDNWPDMADMDWGACK
ncbi:PRC-barrel domain-containing protein [Nitrincola sp. MINF-07-Sa-05]|uniref:PRC-barrel domain-containing protein n=1 Tax=Nitrincola salilacus TaxID=3400273 RepID=UPI003917F3A7